MMMVKIAASPSSHSMGSSQASDTGGYRGMYKNGGTLKFHGLSSVPSNGGHLRLLNAIEPLTQRYEIELTVQPSITLRTMKNHYHMGINVNPGLRNHGL